MLNYIFKNNPVKIVTKIILGTVLISSLFACETVKPDSGKLTIIETLDSSYIPIEGLHISLKKNGAPAGTVQTDKGGKYTFVDLFEEVKADTLVTDWTIEIKDLDDTQNRGLFLDNYIDISDTFELYRVIMKLPESDDVEEE